jgi:hypothetical protein
MVVHRNPELTTVSSIIAVLGDTSDMTTCIMCSQRVLSATMVQLSPCGHNDFCHLCIQMWMRHSQTCPLCRSEVLSTDDDFRFEHNPEELGGCSDTDCETSSVEYERDSDGYYDNMLAEILERDVEEPWDGDAVDAFWGTADFNQPLYLLEENHYEIIVMGEGMMADEEENELQEAENV